MRAYRVAYDGTPYRGFQRQPDVETVEDCLRSALDALGVTDGEMPPGYAGAGRTDAGVSALSQTIAFDAPEWLTPSAFNSELPESVRVWASASVPAEFHATHDADSREYTYFLFAADASESLASEALERLAGEHDFHNLTPDETGTRRTLTATLDVSESFFVLRFRAGGFPRQFVRRAVTLVDDVGHERRELSFIDSVLSEEHLSGPNGIGPASPTPLVVTDVSYCGIEFIPDAEAKSRTRDRFFDRYRKQAGMAEVSKLLAGRSEGQAHRED